MMKGTYENIQKVLGEYQMSWPKNQQLQSTVFFETATQKSIEKSINSCLQNEM